MQSLWFELLVWVAAVLLPLSFKPRLGWFFSITWAAFLAYTACWAFETPGVYEGKLVIPMGMSHYYTNSQALQILALLVFIPYLAFLRGAWAWLIWSALSAVMFIDAGYLAYSWQSGSVPVRGIMDAGTFDAAVLLTYLVVAAGAVFGGPRSLLLKLAWTASFIVAFTLMGTTGGVALIAGAAAVTFRGAQQMAKSFRQRAAIFLAYALVGSGAIYWAAQWHIGRTNYPSSRREIWTRAYESLLASNDWLWGRGPGSFIMHGMTWADAKNTRYVLAHSDVLQIFFEYGAVFGTAFLAFCGVTLYGLYKDGYESFAAGVMYFVVLLTYFPLHYGPSALFGAGLVTVAAYHLNQAPERV